MGSDTIADLIATLAELFADKFATQIFAKIFSNLLQFGRDSRHPQDQAMVVGCIADACSRLTEQSPAQKTMSPFSDTIFKLALRVAAAQDVNMRQNALYCMGAMFCCCDSASNMAHSQAILQCVREYLKFPKDGERAQKLVRDNAVSALGKILICEIKSLPAQTAKDLLAIFLQSLPLTCDFTEHAYVYDVVARFVESKSPFIQPHIELSLTILGMALGDKETPKETCAKLTILFGKITQDAQIRQIVENKLAPQAKQNIFNALNPKTN